MRNSKILLIGMRALANEVAKNLVLAGIGSITVIDHETVREEDLGSQFFIEEEHVGQNRAESAGPAIQRLNPRVTVNIDTSRIQDKDATFFADFDVTIATQLDLDSMIFINDSCRRFNRPFYGSATYGLYGYIFADLIQHTFVIERLKSNMPTFLKNETKTRRITSVTTKRDGDHLTEFVTKQETYHPLSTVITCPVDPTWRPRKRRTIPPVLPCIKALWEFQRQHSLRLPQWTRMDNIAFTKLATETTLQLALPIDTLKAAFISSFVENCTSELSPVAAILGGVLAQDVINVLGKREQSLQNFLVFDGDTQAAPVICLCPEEVETREELGMLQRQQENGGANPATAAVVID